MKEGWARQQSARFLKSSTIDPRIRLLERFEEFTGLYPWQWSPADGEAFIAHLRSGEKSIQMSTARTYEVTIGLFLEYLLDTRYEWARVCEERFGEVPQVVFHEGNSVLHTVEYEGDPRRRPLTYDEVQALFDAADARPSKIRGQGRKGALCALRDAAVLKAVYAFGTRRTETSKLDLVDLRRSRKAPKYGAYGSLMVRFGKASKGAPPKRRTVLTVPEMDWTVDVLQDWVTEIRPQFSPGRHPALWVTERVGRLSPRSINEAFVAARRDADLDEDLDLHCLRHSYITHLTEFGYPARFVQEQVGHSHAGTTAIYMGVSNEYRNKLLEASMKNRLGDDWDATA
ncbi:MULTISPECIES: tyrosine-type recombinase/integrase [unclassified Streptomyces]|uniref:tyrosine-type recombinase/integrase n=1 Tax=unclassified Streptomyces TaxID=2593676 RepID=UPI00080605F7|nr:MULTISPECIES: tyrosine-type recombinase/integrase [unclassified Streptomyces]MYR73667.1 tyrosine-type recombinase/integrase [Streptomyces sp. SID4925]SBV01730.1 Site-specific recombinase XerD [Streptomyces sp. OspMP-M45]